MFFPDFDGTTRDILSLVQNPSSRTTGAVLFELVSAMLCIVYPVRHGELECGLLKRNRVRKWLDHIEYSTYLLFTLLMLFVREIPSTDCGGTSKEASTNLSTVMLVETSHRYGRVPPTVSYGGRPDPTSSSSSLRR